MKYLERHEVSCTLFEGVDHAQFIVCGKSMKKLLVVMKEVVKVGDLRYRAEKGIKHYDQTS